MLLNVHLPRIATAVVVGAMLASSGATYQAVLRNLLADPYLLGVSAGAGLVGIIPAAFEVPQVLFRLSRWENKTHA
ncbi:Hemin transport system permease protein HmuU [Corynebacterium diphtheriae]|nr:hypothetical protein CDPW8_2185 [Corynebacterium diphtheriae PW8]KLN37166.1 hypothetical protein AL07_10720 [Corynebacterium diphtheriae bv. gravis str. ISS 4060]MBG9264576.1 iron chelate uptake ABC transporter family permease subunit [Corynebacterium diphtheriae bv. gravis]OKY21726.1 hypothetical protein AO271_11120 [Corynebacterium diphtheriae]OWM98075.1 hypothetical protein AY476_10880 [Corynebacterium diphtheriae bv. mitis]OWN09044.1 hypothetical protein AY479_10925 [Corynebacterium bel